MPLVLHSLGFQKLVPSTGGENDMGTVTCILLNDEKLICDDVFGRAGVAFSLSFRIMPGPLYHQTGAASTAACPATVWPFVICWLTSTFVILSLILHLYRFILNLNS